MRARRYNEFVDSIPIAIDRESIERSIECLGVEPGEGMILVCPVAQLLSKCRDQAWRNRSFVDCQGVPDQLLDLGVPISKIEEIL